MVRAAPASIRSSTSPSSSPSALATSSCSSSTSRSSRRPVTSCSACRAPRICSYAVRTLGPGAGATQAAATAWIACTSRSPPLASFRSGSSRKASSPLILARSSCAATRATSASAPRSPASHRSTWAVRRARSAANVVMASTRVPRATCEPPSDRVRPALPGADSDHGLDRDRPDLAVADPAGMRRLDHHADEVVGVLVLAEDLDPDLRHQVDLVLSTAVHLRVPALPAVSACFGDRQAVDAERLQRGLDVVQLERLDDSGDELHLVSLRQPVPRFRCPRFIRPAGVCQPRETPGLLVTAMFPGR